MHPPENENGICPVGLILGGAPKCGTSSLYAWLDQSPHFVGSRPKETHYFLDEGHPLQKGKPNYHHNGLKGYARFWPDAAQGIRFEASTHYLYSQTARRYFSQLPQPPLMVFVLREPAARVYSSFRYSMNNLAAFHKKISFAEYVSILVETPAKLEGLVRREQSRYVLSRDLQYSRYAIFLQDWLRSYPQEKMKVCFFEEAVKDPSEWVTGIHGFFGLEHIFEKEEAQAQNQTEIIKNTTLHRWARSVNRNLKLNGPLKKIAKKLYKNTFTAPAQHSAEDKEALRQLKSHFAKSNQELQIVVNRELPWNT